MGKEFDFVVVVIKRPMLVHQRLLSPTSRFDFIPRLDVRTSGLAPSPTSENNGGFAVFHTAKLSILRNSGL